MKIDVDKLFSWACSGEINKLEKYYNSGGEKNLRCQAFGHENSLLIGAYRNRQYGTVEFLLQQGETLTDEEQEEINQRYLEMKILEKMSTLEI